MHTTVLNSIVIAILFLGITTVGTHQVFAETFDDDLPLKYDIELDLVDIGDVDLVTGSYEMVFWIYLSSDEINFNDIKPPQLDYVNAKELTVLAESVDEHLYQAKIYGKFFTNDMDFRSYSYMKVDLVVIIETADKKIDEVRFTILPYDDDDEKFDILTPG